MSVQRIHQDLVAERQFEGSYYSVRRYVLRLSKRLALPFRRLEVEPGEEMQVDFGQGAWVLEEGKRRRPHLFRVVLSRSRKGYGEAVWRQTTENFIRCLENAFRYFKTGYAASEAVMLFLIVLALTLIQFGVTRQKDANG